MPDNSSITKLNQEIERLLRKKELKADELESIAKKCGWKVREPPKNQPHMFKEGVPDYIVIDKRYGEKTIQKQALWKKYLKRLKENLL